MSWVALALLLAGPAVLAFWSGGYFSEPRLIAGIVAWSLVLLLALVGPAPLPRTLAGRLALGGLVLIAVWSAISISWAPLKGPAVQNVQRLVLYVGALVVAVGVLRTRAFLRVVEPALAAGATIVISYGLSGRLLPGIVHLSHSERAGGRLEQPITYWNAEGALAAVGFVLCARLVGDRTRPVAIRALAAAAAVPLGAGIYLSYSRGAIAAAIVGLVILIAAAPWRAQLRGVVVVLVAGVVAAAVSSAFPGVASLHGGLGSRESDGAIVLAVMVVLAAAAALVTARFERRSTDQPLPRPRRLGLAAAAVVGLAVVGLIVGGLNEKVSSSELARANSARLTSVESNRYEYWRVGWLAFKDHPLKGLGSGGFQVLWLEKRRIREGVQQVHSIELEMAAELGIVGLLGFGLMVGGTGVAARRALRRDRVLAAGMLAALVTWLLHASIDWDWQMPAVSLPAIALAGALIALGEADAAPAAVRELPEDRAAARPRAPA